MARMQEMSPRGDDDVILRVCNGRGDGCFVGLNKNGDGTVRIRLYSPFDRTEPEIVDADNLVNVTQVVEWLQDRLDY